MTFLLCSANEGSVALTSWSAVRLHPGKNSGGNLEELIHKADLIVVALVCRRHIATL